MGKVIVTGAEGFIGSNLIKYLNLKGVEDIVVVDPADNGYLKGAAFSCKMNIEEFILWCISSTRDNVRQSSEEYDAVFHLGALVDTMSDDLKIMDYNLTFSKIVADFCSARKVPLLYASSAAVYGNSSIFREDKTDLQPLNLYAKSKYLFDKYLLESSNAFTQPWYGFRFFNVFGPNEGHKGAMISAVTRIWLNAVRDGEIRLFKSVDPEIRDGFQKRDFIHVDKVVQAMYHFYLNRKKIPSGIYNIGTGRARTFIEISDHINKSLSGKLKIKFIEMPERIKNCYQSFTQADTEKLSGVMDLTGFDNFESAIDEHYRFLGSQPAQQN